MGDNENGTEGSRLGSMFGYVTPADQMQWAQARQMNQPKVSTAKKSAKAGLESLYSSLERKLTSQLRAADQVAAQARFEEENTRSTSKRWDSKTQSIVETVEFDPVDQRQPIDPDFDPYAEHDLER